MKLQISDRVTLLDTPHNRQRGVDDAHGVVVGVSYEDETPDVHEGYAVKLDGVKDVDFVLPDGVAAERK